MKILFLIMSFYFFSINLFAQAFPIYNRILDRKNQSSLKKSIGNILPVISLGVLGVFGTQKVQPLEETEMRQLGAENNIEENIVENLEDNIQAVIEEEELLSINTAVKIAFSTAGVSVVLAWSLVAFEHIPTLLNSESISKNKTSFNYKYFIKNENGESLCSGLKSFSLKEDNLFISHLDWKELNINCNNKLKKGETFFVKIENLLGTPFLNSKWQKIVFNL